MPESATPLPNDRRVRLPNGDPMHYVELGPPDAEPVVLVHGYPTSAYLYRNVMRELCRSGRRRCIAPTLIGFGASSCPADGRAVSPAYEADRLDEFLRALPLDRFALVVHDWGGPIGMAAGLRHAPALSHLVVLNTSLRFGSDGWLRPFMALAGALTALPMSTVARAYPWVVARIMQRFTTTPLPPDVLAAYRAPFEDPATREGRMRASLRLFGQAHASEPLYREIERGLAAWHGPALFLWGTDDPLMGPGTALGVRAHEALARLLPQAATVRIAGAHHFMQEDRPVEIAAAIAGFLDGRGTPDEQGSPGAPR